MIIDSHAHAGVRSELDWDFASVAEHRAYDQRLLWTRLNIGRKLEVRRWDDDSLVEDGWETLWDPRYPNSWEGRRDVNLRVAVEKADEWHANHLPATFAWEHDGEQYYAAGPLVLSHLKAAPPELLVQLMDQAGIDKAVLHCLDPLNKYFARLMLEYPQRFIGLCRIEESTAYTDQGLEALRVAVEDLGLMGMYHEPLPGWEGYEDFHTAKYDPFWREVERLRFPLYLFGCFYRTFDQALPRLQALLKKFPGLTIILVHGLPPWYIKDGIPAAARDLVRNHEIYLELLPKILHYGKEDEIVRRVFDTFGPRKLVWGSEFVTYNVTGPPFTAERYREHLRYLERRCDYLSRDDLDLILGGNLDAVFNAYAASR